MMNYKHLSIYALAGLMALAACNPKDPIPEVISEETYAGGELGTTFKTPPLPSKRLAWVLPSSTASISLSAPTHKATSLSTALVLFISVAAVSLAIPAMVTECA